jgi:tRNA A-37 threonylcarbamoyl transferase component Bud32
VDYGGGRLPAAERDALREHAADCAACRLALSELGRSQAPPASSGLSESQPDGDSVLQRYQLRKRLGAGAMGVVYIAHDTQLDREVALKILHDQPTGGSAAAIEEARSLARVRHPNVVTVFDAAPHVGNLCIVMEYVDGVTLRSWLAQGARPWRRILELFIDAGRGLAAAHAAGIAHGDFKPENVLVSRDGRVQVGDFGLARPARAMSGSAVSLLGTPAYMAPEQLGGAGADARTDQFAFCVALHEALYGRRPFVADSVDELRRQMRERPPSLPADLRLPRAVTRALARGLAAAPEARHPSMNALCAALESWPRRRQLFAGSIAAVALALLSWRAFRPERPPMNRVCRVDARHAGAALNDRRRAARGPSAPAGADPALDGADLALEAYVRRWVTARVGACEDADATAASDPGTNARYQQRMRCFDDLRDRTEAAIAGAFRAPAEARTAEERVAALPLPETCLTH